MGINLVRAGVRTQQCLNQTVGAMFRLYFVNRAINKAGACGWSYTGEERWCGQWRHRFLVQQGGDQIRATTDNPGGRRVLQVWWAMRLCLGTSTGWLCQYGGRQLAGWHNQVGTMRDTSYHYRACRHRQGGGEHAACRQHRSRFGECRQDHGVIFVFGRLVRSLGRWLSSWSGGVLFGVSN